MRRFAFLLLVSCVLSAPTEDEIINLPGLDYAINFKHYSGYLDAGDGNWLHYWFTESQSDPTKDPLLLWLNGGPGCSSLDGLLTELGPYFVNADGSGLYENEYAWNTFANVIYLESPVCVGFSYDTNKTCKVSDDGVAEQNYNAIKDFYAKFPEYSSNDNEFYITGESYAGVYIPTLSIRVLDGMDDFSINFQGFAIGNGLLSYGSNSNSLYFYGNYHGLLGESLWGDLVHRCCDDIESQDSCAFLYNISTACEASVLIAEKQLYYNGLNMYNLYGDCLHPEDSNGTSRYQMDIRNLMHFSERNDGAETRADPPCFDSSNLRTYLNSVETRTALHIPSELPDWDVCNDEVGNKYLRNYIDMHDSLLYLNDKVRGLIYNGDVDMACNVVGNLWDVKGLELTELEAMTKWIDEYGQIGGYVTKYQNLDFLTVRGSGHMVPTDKPSQALQMIKAFVTNATNYNY